MTNTCTTNSLVTKGDQKSSICLQCGSQFETHEVMLLDRKIIPSLCDQCADDRDERIQDWTRICPFEFRLPNEGGGNTSLARMDKSCPQWRNVLDWEYGPKGLLIRGETGRCKTRAMWRLLRKLFNRRMKIIAMTSARFDRECRDAGGNFTLTGWFERAARADIFFLDDLGKGAWTQATEAQAFDLIDTRTREGRPILCTSNDTGESLASRLSDDRAEPLVRRLRDYCTTHVL